VSEEIQQEYVSTLKQMVDCKTVFQENGENQAEFERFYQVLRTSFPMLHKAATLLTFGSGCFVYHIPGKDAAKHLMLMSHHDVVDATPGWETDAFCVVEKDGALYGRGTIDTKTPLFAQLQACEELLAEGFVPDGFDIYLGSSNNEEVSGDGMPLAVEYFKEQGIVFDVVLDEGGAITQGMIPGVQAKSAVVAVHEKGRHLYRCKAKSNAKGHGGLLPSKDKPMSRMNQFIYEVEHTKIYKPKFAPEVEATFTRHAPYMSQPLGFLFGNMKLFSPILKKVMGKIPQAREMLATSLSFTTIQAGDASHPQIQAKEVEATLFLRCVREDDLYEGLEKIKRIASKYEVEIEEVMRDFCRPTSFEGPAFAQLERVLHDNFPDVIVAPFLLTAGTDARRFSEIAIHIFRFAPIDLNAAQFASIHGDNEHIQIENIGQCVCFYKDWILRYDKK
jgi:carboxypeptidase PM20D1